MTFEQTEGSKAQVYHGTAKRTSGGLTKKALMKNKHGRIISRKKHALGKKSIKHLVKKGYKAKKGQFMLFHKKTRKGSRKMRGGDMDSMDEEMDDESSSDEETGSMGGRRGRKMRGGTASKSGMLMSSHFSPQARALGASGGGKRSRRMSGGMALGGPFSPSTYHGEGVGTSGVNLQFVAGSH